MRLLFTLVLAVSCMLPLSSAVAEGLPQTPLGTHAPAAVYPRIVLYSTSWCQHCKAAKEYLTRKEIPFINRDVEVDAEAMELLTGKYQSQGVPVIVIGNDAEVVKGFEEKRFEKVLEKYKKK
jgi:glutaredoxin 3